jgi:hypothetical protein
VYSQIIDALEKASIPVRQLHGQGCAAVTLAAGRIVALAFSQHGPNLLWSNPELANAAGVKGAPEKLAGGIGGDRLWFSPELRYHWSGAPDWRDLSNYEVPPATDPGQYVFVDSSPGVVALAAKGRLPVRGSDQYLDFTVERSIRMTVPPLPSDHPLMRSVDFVGIETTHQLSIDTTTKSGEIDLWHVLQVPVGSILIVPLRPGHVCEPLSYGLPGGWQVTPDSIIWRIEGKANAKLGIAAESLTGRSAVIRKVSTDRWCLIVRQFPADASARYGDHPHGVSRNDQAFQAWDGLGFGEMEYHSPVLDAAHGPRTLQDQDQLWAFGSYSAQAIAALAGALLSTDIHPLLAHDRWMNPQIPSAAPEASKCRSS